MLFGFLYRLFKLEALFLKDYFFISLKASLLFCLARKVAKEHTAIQERSFLSALLPTERL